MQTKVKIINFGRLYAKLRGQQILCNKFHEKSQITPIFNFDEQIQILSIHLNIEINTKMLYFGRFYANL